METTYSLGPKRSKYNNVRTMNHGIPFASKKESRRYNELLLLEHAGEIKEIEVQPTYPLVVNGVKVCVYRADFRYVEVATGAVIVEDCKGGNATRTAVYILKRKLMKALYNIDIFET